MRWLLPANSYNGDPVTLSSQNFSGHRSITRFFRDEPIRSFLLLSLVVHLFFLISWPRPRNYGHRDMDRIAVLLMNQPKQPPARQATPAKKVIPRKKSAISKKKRIIVANKPTIKKSPIKKTKPAARNKKPDLSKIRQKLAKEEEKKAVSRIKTRLARNKTANQPVAISAVGNYQLNRYAEQLKAWITDHWQLPELLLQEKLSATVSLTINASGNLVKQKPEKMSGNRLFDDSILRAIARSAPFPSFPPAMDKTQEEFIITFDPHDIQ